MAQLSNNYYNFVIIKLCISYLCFIPGDRYMIEAYNISKAPAIVVFNSQGWSTDLIFLLPCRFCTMGTNIQPSKECHCLWFIKKRSYTVKEKKRTSFCLFYFNVFLRVERKRKVFISFTKCSWSRREKTSSNAGHPTQPSLPIESGQFVIFLRTFFSMLWHV